MPKKRTQRRASDDRAGKARRAGVAEEGAVGRLIHERLERVRRALKRLPAEGEDSAALAVRVHRLRVACRRAGSTLSALDGALPEKVVRRLRKHVRGLRRSCGARRDYDVLIKTLREREAGAEGAARKRYRALRVCAEKQAKRSAVVGIDADRMNESLEELLRLERRLAAKVADASARTDAKECVEGRIDERVEILKGLTAGLAGCDDDRLHRVRIAVKRLRYTIDAYRSAWVGERYARVERELAGLQRALGTFNDQFNLVRWLRGPLEGVDDGVVRAVLKAEEAGLASLREGAKAKWARFESTPAWRGLVERVRRAAKGAEKSGETGSAGGVNSVGLVDVKPLVARGTSASALRAKTGAGVVGATGAGELNGTKRSVGGKVRLAAIDVGSNSIRLIIAETNADGSYRVLDDEKEITRLGRGLHTHGKMDPDAIEHTAVTVERMVSIAKGYGAVETRVIATAAARDGANSGDLVRRIRERTGLEVRVISAVQEAEYAYRSAARAFDLSGTPALVVDIGGGSTELVLSVGSPEGGDGRGGGVIERVFTVPVGAVRLAERFGGEPDVSRDRFDELRKYVRRLIKEHVGTPRVYPTVVIGTGGTLTTLAGMVVLRDAGVSGAGEGAGGAMGGLFDRSVQGQQIKRADLRHMMDLVRKTPVKARPRIPGLPADRADIILPGLVLADAVLARFECNTIRAHEGGIRDGLMLSMVAERTGGGVAEGRDGASVMRGVRRFARACSYERAHSEHVARLSLSLFDQLRGAWEALGVESAALTDRDRLLLEASAVLHDVGYLINYARHHKHSYHLIVHANLSGLTTREKAVVANVARYHRSAEPKVRHAAFSALEEGDRALVRWLSGVLRVADGLDRTHTQSVTGIELDVGAAQIVVRVTSASEPSVDIWGSHRKSGLLGELLKREVAYDWTSSASASGAREGGEGPGGAVVVTRKRGVVSGGRGES